MTWRIEFTEYAILLFNRWLFEFGSLSLGGEVDFFRVS